MDYATVARALEAEGFVPRGGFRVAPEDAVPPLPDGRPAATLVLAGDAGGKMWRTFEKARAPGPDPLDRWTRDVLGRVADMTGGTTYFPFGGPPYLPFQRWAQRAEPVHPSPIGVLIHPDWGLWHAYRGALGFAENFAVPERADQPSPCATCAEKPCLSTCPVDAFGPGGYDVAACVDHVERPQGRGCAEGGCLARRACPIGARHGPTPDQAAFHMAAFVRARRAAQAAREPSGASEMKR